MDTTRVCLFLVATLAGAADLAGTWRFEQTSNNGRKRVITYVFRTDGNQFTGDFATLTERREILNGGIAPSTRASSSTSQAGSRPSPARSTATN